ncbi:MAG: pantoate--beta-alanine ligase [Ginsengibacter sp.]
MVIFKKFRDYQKFVFEKKTKEDSIGFVPTMGALHNGHLSLILECKKIASITVASIFVNPKQFNNKDDYDKYPNTIEQDIALLENSGCDVLLLPNNDEVYPPFFKDDFEINLGKLEIIFEGEFRPGHFKGVYQAVNRLLNVVKPNFLVMGSKDFQQCLVIKELLKQTKSEIKLVMAPTKRENSGLAMSSRNLRLLQNEQLLASNIYEVLSTIKKEINEVPLSTLLEYGRKKLSDSGFIIDYLNIANAKDLSEIDTYDTSIPSVILVAATLNGVRLIDNLQL